MGWGWVCHEGERVGWASFGIFFKKVFKVQASSQQIFFLAFDLARKKFFPIGLREKKSWTAFRQGPSF